MPIRMKPFATTFLLSLLASPVLEAHPAAFGGATSVISENSPDANHLTVHYSFTPRVSLGAHLTRMLGHSKDEWMLTSQTGLLLHRWNQKDFQANLYAFGGLGGLRHQGKTDLVGRSGAQFDIEDRRYYFMTEYSNHLIRNREDRHDLKLRAGLAPYLADYEELNSWLIVQYEFQPQSHRKHELTPLLRFFYRNVLLEAGSSLQGKWLLNLMVHF